MVQSLTGNEPEQLALGDTGEWVLTLQIRLYLLGFYRDWPDSTYDLRTESAVRELQSARGLTNDGVAGHDCWEAILYFEQQGAIDYYWHSPYDALAQIRYDLENPAANVGSLSEDGQWWWDGTQWQAADRTTSDRTASDAAASDPAASDPAASDPNTSEDGRWHWDGSSWVENDLRGTVGQLSEDGYWRWDGWQWHAA